jgi:hypothetical protein
MVERVVTVQEPGKPGQKCKLVKTWKTVDGATAYQVQVIATGEMMTLLESGPVASLPGAQTGTRVQAMATKIFHWGHGATPPTGSPMPPMDSAVSMPAAAPLAPVPTAPIAPSSQPVIVPMSNSEPVSAPPAQHISPIPMTSRSVPQSNYAPITTTPVVGQECVTAPVSSPVIVNEHVTVSSTKEYPVSPTIETKAAPCAPCADAKETVVVNGSQSGAQVLATTPYPTVPTTEPGKPTEWRQSWGKADDHKSHFTLKSFILPQADTKKPDPLQSPTEYRQTTNADSSFPTCETTTVSSAAAPVTILTPPNDTAVAAPSSHRSAPLGMGSVLAATDGDTSGVHFPPVPAVTLPDSVHAPTPPTPYIGQPPQPPRFGNTMVAAPVMPPMNRALGPVPTTTDPGMVNAFIAVPSDEAVARATNAFGPAATPPAAPMLAGYGQPAPNALTPSPYAGMTRMIPPMNPYGGQSQGIIQAGYHSQPAIVTPPGMDRSMATLRNSLYPSQREWAAECLIAATNNPQAIGALATAAREDPAPSVRAACVRSLAKMHCNAPPVMATIQALQGDMDPRVRQEVEHAVMVLGASQPASPDMPTVLPAAVIPSR